MPDTVRRAASYEEIGPLVEMCRAGRLFDAQAWIAAGKPVNPPASSGKGRRLQSPLQCAIETGFHSLVEVLLKAGAEIERAPRYSALEHALRSRRFEIVRLLVDHGADAKAVDMNTVFDTWQPEWMEFFIERGADVETGHPLALAFCNRIRTALGIYRKYSDRFPGFREQAGIALRYHVREGNMKWASLMLWLGVDPYARGLEDPWNGYDYDNCAMELAVQYRHYEFFKLRSVQLDPRHAQAHGLVETACGGDSAEFLKQLLDRGFPVNDQPNGGSSHIGKILNRMGWVVFEPRRNIDTDESRERMKMLHLIVRRGARWRPDTPDEIGNVRRSLLRMSADYTAELIWIMAKYGRCRKAVIGELLRTPSIRVHLSSLWGRVMDLTEQLPVEEASGGEGAGGRIGDAAG